MKKSKFGVVALATLLLASCGGTSSVTSVEGDGKLAAASITWWNNYKTPTADEKSTLDDAALRKKYAEYYYAEDAIAAFEAAQPNVTVEQVYKGSYSDIAKAVNAGLATGDTPNMVSTYQDYVYAYNSTEGAVLDMTEYATELEQDSDFNQNYLSIEKGIYGGKYLSLPYSKSGEMLVVNKSAFDLVGAGNAGVSVGNYVAPVAAESKTAYTVPTSWDEMITTARKIKTDFPTLFASGVNGTQKDADGYFVALPICWDSNENMAITFLQNAGIEYTVGTASTPAAQVPVFDNADAKALFVQLKKWNMEGLLGTQQQLPMSGKYHIYGSEMFYTGKSFMNISSTAGASYFAADGFTASVNRTPTYNGHSKVISQGPSLAFFDKDLSSNTAAYEFYKFLTQPAQAATLTSIDSYFPLRTTTYNEAAVKTLTDAATATVAADTETGTYASKRNTYVGQAINLNKTYTNNSDFYISDVFAYSAKARTAIGNLITSLFNDTDASTDAEIVTLVDTLCTQAKSEVFTA